ncbi:hypothetical protein [Streptomyces erythrochromogenes]|uniref:hypothetical protein n=1 Tax=Streptomyces erythrochromogenes TaxID=285574 RepID=UPI0037CE6B1F
MDIDSYTALASAVVALGASCIGVAAWKTSKRAADAAEAAVVEARRSALASERSAQAGELQAAAATETLAMQQEAARPRVQLRIDRPGRGTWALVNYGSADAINPALHSEDADLVDWEDPLGPVLAQGDVRHLSARYAADTPPVLRFTWDGQEEPFPVRCPSQA